MKNKVSKSARPRFHVYFPTEEITDADEYAQYKEKIQAVFSYFDDNALDAARKNTRLTARLVFFLVAFVVFTNDGKVVFFT